MFTVEWIVNEFPMVGPTTSNAYNMFTLFAVRFGAAENLAVAHQAFLVSIFYPSRHVGYTKTNN